METVQNTKAHNPDPNEKLSLSLMDTALDSIWVVDDNYCLKYGNQEFHKNFMLLTGKTILIGESLFPPEISGDLKNKWKAWYDRVLKSGESFSVELESLESNVDSYKQYSFSPVYANQSGITGILVIGRDVTLKKQTEQALRRSEQHALALIEAIPDMIFRLNEDLIFTDYKADKKDLYQQPEMFIGKKMDEVMPAWFTELIKKKIERIRRSDDLEFFEYELPDAENTILEFECRLSPTSDREIIAIVRNITERKRIEKELLESEARARAIMESTTDVMFLLNKEGLVLDCNQTFTTVLGLPREKVVGKNMSDLLPAKLKEEYSLFFDEVRDSTKPYHGTSVIDGIWREFSFYPVMRGKEVSGNFAVFVKDVTERKKAEEELRAAVQFNANLIESMQDGFSVLDINGVHIKVNDALCRLTGYSGNELIGTGPPHPYWPPEDYDKIGEAFNKTRNSDSANLEMEFKHKDGRRFPVIVSSVVIRNELGEVVNYAATVKDITERKMAEEALRASENKYRALHESLRDGFVNTNMEGRIIEFNDYYQNMLGYESDEISSLTYLNLTPEKWHAYEQEIVEKQVLTRGYSDIYLKEYIKKNGEVFPVELRTILIRNDAGENVGMWAIVRDITERKQTEDALRESEKRLSELNATKDKFFSIIAHDLKNPFNSILGFSDVLQNEAVNLDAGQIETYAGIIHESARQTLRLLENLLDWARMQQGRMTFEPRPLILHEVIGGVIDLSSEHFQIKNIDLINEVPPQLIVRADEEMLKSIIRNLLSNALKFTRSGGVVKAFAVEKNNMVEVSVSDNGVGISEENQKRLFMTGTSFSLRGTEKEKGTGLGLILCKEFVEKHKGNIWVKSQEGRGSDFCFTVPLS